jgi:hypothetical protein
MPSLIKLNAAGGKAGYLDFMIDGIFFTDNSDEGAGFPLVTAFAKNTATNQLIATARMIGPSTTNQRNWIFFYNFANSAFTALTSLTNGVTAFEI